MIPTSNLRRKVAVEGIAEEVVVGFVDGEGVVAVDIAEGTVVDEVAVAIIRITNPCVAVLCCSSLCMV